MKPALITIAVMLALLVYLVPRGYSKQSPADTQQNIDNQPIHSQTETAAPEKEPPHWYKAPEWVLVMVGLITAFVIGWQSWETRRSADAANRNIDVVMDERRARVEIIAGGVGLSNTAINGITVSLKNIGPTIATIVEVAAGLVSVPPGPLILDYGQCIHLGFTGSISPGATTSTQIIFLQPQASLTTPQIIEIQGGQSVIHFYGYTRYRDVYDQIHRVQVHLQWWIHRGLVISAQGGQQVTEYWLKTGEANDNSDSKEETMKNCWMNRLDGWLDSLSEPN